MGGKFECQGGGFEPTQFLLSSTFLSRTVLETQVYSTVSLALAFAFLPLTLEAG